MLFNIITVTGKQPVGVKLKGNGREVRVTDPHARKHGDDYDIYKGEYLEQIPVALKKLRSIGVKEKEFQRFWRQSQIWRQVWEVDQGKHILQYIGTVADEGNFPYMVSPWQKNGTVLDWIKANPTCNRITLMRGIAEGPQVLHGWFPEPIIHGGIRAENVLISDDGNPLLADFSLSKVLENIGGVPITNSKGFSSYYRWSGPEVATSNKFTPETDIFALAMTMLELITGELPYGQGISNTQVLLRMQPPEKLRPRRPEGINDALWKLITDCWEQEPEHRPNIAQVVTRLREIE